MGAYVAPFSSDTNRQSSAYLPLKQVISLLEKLDECRLEIAEEERVLERKKQDLARITQEVLIKLEELTPSAREFILGMLNQSDGLIAKGSTQEKNPGKTR